MKKGNKVYSKTVKKKIKWFNNGYRVGLQIFQTKRGIKTKYINIARKTVS